MEHYAGIDVSLERSSVCVVDAQGKIVKEAKVASEPEAVVAFFETLSIAVKRIGLEAGPLSQWLHAGPQIQRRMCIDRRCCALTDSSEMPIL
jgi:transposase